MPSKHRLYNSRTIDIYRKYLRKNYPEIDVDSIFEAAGVRPYQVADPNYWFTQTETDSLVVDMIKATENPNLPREVGRFCATAEGNSLQSFLLGLVSPQKVFESAEKFLPLLTRSANYSGSAQGPNKAELVVRPYRGVEEKPYQCLNRIGYIESVPLLFSNALPAIEHSECIFTGGNCCRYTITWKEPRTAKLSTLRNALTLFLIPGLAAGFYASPWLTTNYLLPTGLIVLLALSVIIEKTDKKELLGNLKKLRDAKENLSAQIDVNSNNSLAATEIGQTITQAGNREDVLDRVLEIFKKRLDFDRGSILLLDPLSSVLRCTTTFGYAPEQAQFLKKTLFRLDDASQEIFARCIRDKTPVLVDGGHDAPQPKREKSFFLRQLGAHSFIACPIIVDEKAIGVLAVDNISSKRPLLQSDISLLMGIAPVIGVNLQNSHLIDSRERQMNAILEALAATIDARDPLTAGHSLKVTEYAVGICEEMGFDPDTTELIRVSALLHDYGKIGIPDAILKKKGKLTPDEYATVKTHTERTREILERINFEGQLKGVPAIAAAHHEKLDGSGYPLGLTGEEIPLGARIIAVADFFEALTSKRHYREPLSADFAIGLIQQESGAHFDPQVVEAFLKHLQNAPGPAWEKPLTNVYYFAPR